MAQTTIKNQQTPNIEVINIKRIVIIRRFQSKK